MSNKVKNGDLPASEMTKREMMAANAPEIPLWFENEWTENNRGSNDFFSDIDEVDMSGRFLNGKGQSSMYFAWRVHYATQLLEALEKSK